MHTNAGAHFFRNATGRQVMDSGRFGAESTQEAASEQTGAAKGFWTTDDRYIMFFWIHGSKDSTLNLGWDSMQSLPREAWVDDELTPPELALYPAEETERLRVRMLARRSFTGAQVAGWARTGGEFRLDEVHGNTIDIELEAQFRDGQAVPAGVQVGLVVLQGSVERTIVWVETLGDMAVLSGDFTRSTTLDINGSHVIPQCDTAPNTSCVFGPPAMKLKQEESMLSLRLVTDRSVVEAFAQGGRRQLTSRVYPNQTESSGVSVLFRGDAANLTALRVTVWAMDDAALDFSQKRN